MLIITGSKMIWSIFTNDTACGILELIAYATSEGSDESVHPHSLARATYTPKQELVENKKRKGQCLTFRHLAQLLISCDTTFKVYMRSQSLSHELAQSF